MKSIKIISITTICTFILFVGTVGCFKDKNPIKINGTYIEPCLNVVCYNGGNCLNGICHCPIGFEGKDCQDKWNDNYTGTYTANDVCTAGSPYTVTISPVINKANGILIANIGSFASGINVEANIAPNKTTIDFGPTNIGNNIYVSGVGTQTEAKDYVNIWMNARDSINHSTSSCSIVLKKN